MWGGSTGYTSHRELKSVCNAILQAKPGGSAKPAWASVPITFGYHDCPNNLTYRWRNSFGIFTTDTLGKMQVPRSPVKPISNHFYGVIPGLAHKTVGQIILPVTFRNKDNFCTE